MALAMAHAAGADPGVNQSGSVIRKHAVGWIKNSVIGDSGGYALPLCAPIAPNVTVACATLTISASGCATVTSACGGPPTLLAANNSPLPTRAANPPVSQSGPVIRNHSVNWLDNGVIGDAGGYALPLCAPLPPGSTITCPTIAMGPAGCATLVSGSCAGPPPTSHFLLLQTGGHVLLQSGGSLLLQSN